MKNYLSEWWAVENLVMRIHKPIELLENVYYIYNEEVWKERKRERERKKGGKGGRKGGRKEVSFKI